MFISDGELGRASTCGGGGSSFSLFTCTSGAKIPAVAMETLVGTTFVAAVMALVGSTGYPSARGESGLKIAE